jgi:Delta-aminolevulinic acid dehydratase
MFSRVNLGTENLIYPLFVTEGQGVRNPISSMPGNFQMSVDNILAECGELIGLGINSILLFGIPAMKDEVGSSGYASDGVIQTAVRKIKEAYPELVVITDVCLCEYTSHGHCGVIVDGDVHNDETLPLLIKQALSHAESGADMVAPSDMMDGRVGEIRKALDSHGFTELPIMAYSAKFASAFYGPFRDAAESAPKFGNRKTYQMDFRNADEALREVALDIAEGADIVMVKPALAYLDIIRSVRENFNIPIAAYQVSGEFSMIKAAAANGWIDEESVMMESLYAIRRAGADAIITYFAKEAAGVLATR